MFRKALLILLALLLTAGALTVAGAESAVPSPEPPEAAPTHSLPSATPVPSAVQNLVADPDALDTVHFKMDAEFLHIWFPNIYNEDEALLIFGDEVWMIDCGDTRSAPRNVLLLYKLGVRRINKLFNSHPHHDHLGGLEATDNAAHIEELLVCFPEDSTDTMMAAMLYASSADIPVSTYSGGDVFTMGGGKVSLTFYLVEGDELDMNNCSAQTMVQYGSRKMLFTADMERQGQELAMTQVNPDLLQADILKYPHHGKSGLQDDYAAAVNPSLAIVTNTKVDWGGVEYLDYRKIPFLYTGYDEVYTHIYTDGNVWVVEQIPVADLLYTGNIN